MRQMKRSRDGEGGRISKASIVRTERSYEGKEAERLRQETHTSVWPSQTHTFRHGARTHWCAAVVAALAHVSMLRLQSVASFAEDHGGGEVTAFLDRAASLCHFLAVSRVCRVCSASVCLKILQSCQTEQVDSSTFDRLCVCHFVGVATFICFSCPLPYFPSFSLLGFLFLKDFSLLLSDPFPDLLSRLNPRTSLHRCYQQHRKLLLPSIWWQEEGLQMWSALCVPPSLSVFFLLSFR